MGICFLCFVMDGKSPEKVAYPEANHRGIAQKSQTQEVFTTIDR